ncbi:hypothetical protein C464_01526 [Halorubrum coriense DSM 10284]|uniref:Uncharacterized protein n=1 Tax=Halorubrum coriense DSM 10284 TaxID=1227466 RepID=M0EXG5_9EURY|nr:hypothetical protein C464_01526 [Halorubrum coriense DSM 10284]
MCILGVVLGGWLRWFKCGNKQLDWARFAEFCPGTALTCGDCAADDESGCDSESDCAHVLGGNACERGEESANEQHNSTND